MSGNLVKIGIFGPAHGVRGQICLRSFAQQPKDILSYSLVDNAGKGFQLTLDGVKGDYLIVKIEGLADRNAAEQLRGTELFVRADELPAIAQEDQWYHNDLIGLKGITQDGAVYGSVLAVHNFGAGDILEFELADGGQEMLPFNRHFVGKIDKKAGTIAVIPPEYLEAK